jgi:hypothetical protein
MISKPDRCRARPRPNLGRSRLCGHPPSNMRMWIFPVHVYGMAVKIASVSYTYMPSLI